MRSVVSPPRSPPMQVRVDGGDHIYILIYFMNAGRGIDECGDGDGDMMMKEYTFCLRWTGTCIFKKENEANVFLFFQPHMMIITIPCLIAESDDP